MLLDIIASVSDSLSDMNREMLVTETQDPEFVYSPIFGW